MMTERHRITTNQVINLFQKIEPHTLAFSQATDCAGIRLRFD